MARKKSESRNETNMGGFVPASLTTAHTPHRSMDLPTISNADFTAPGSLGHYSRNSADYSNRKKSGGGSRGPKVAVAILLILLVGICAALGFYVFRESQKAAINQDLHGSMTVDEMEAVDAELTGMTTFDEPMTILLLGSDERVDDPDMGARTDSIILVRVDPTQNIVCMVSIPRDTRITVPGAGTQKFNAAYTYGGPSGTIAAVKDLCGVDIDHYAEINFDGLVGLIDAIGGIDIYVEKRIDDPDAGDVVIEEGEQHLDGEAALVYSRSRAYVNGDFTRVSNQRKVIEAIARRALEAPATELYGLLKASTAFLTTDSNMDVDFIYSLADQIRHNEEPLTLYSATIPATTETVDGISYVVAQESGVRNMMQIFMEGGDVSNGESNTEIALQAIDSE